MSNTRRSFLQTGVITIAGLAISPKIIFGKTDRTGMEINNDKGSAPLDNDDPVGTALDQSFIWASPEIAPQGKQIYIAFRKTFYIEKMPLLARLAIFADSRYRLWINSHFIESGPCRFDPRWPEYDMHDVRTLLKPGLNVIVVLVHAYEIGSFTNWGEQCARMMDHRPGLTAQLHLDLPNGEQYNKKLISTWKLNSKTRFCLHQAHIHQCQTT